MWLDALCERGVFRGCRSIFELGPQDLFVPRSLLEGIVRKHVPVPQATEILQQIFEFSPDSTYYQEAFYRVFGFEVYSACDALDRRAEHRVDLNFPVPEIGCFDCVTDFGTAEHVYSIGEVFRSVHRLLRPGGVALHVLPAFGDVNHGFYNVHPGLYFDIAESNSYAVLDLVYVDNMEVRCERQNAAPGSDQLKEMSWRQYAGMTQIEISRRLSDQYSANVCAPDTRAYLARNPNGYVVDYCFVAMRKPERDTPFVSPFQNSTAGWRTMFQK